MTHLAYNLHTGEVLTTDRANHLKRWVARHTAHDRKWLHDNGYDPVPAKWVFAHGGSYTDCVAKLTARGIWG